MPWPWYFTVGGLVVLAFLIWFFIRTRSKDLLAEIVQKKRANSQVVSTAEYAEGAERMPVVVSLSGDTFYYQNTDIDASFELARIDEIEYDDELATGRSLPNGMRALRLRSHGQTFEFILPQADVGKWTQALPPRRIDQARAV